MSNLTAATVLALLVGADALSAQEGTLKNPAQAITWSGTLSRDGAPSGEVPECADTACARFDLDLSLPPGVWNQKPGGVQVALRWNGYGNNLFLAVYDAHGRVGSGTGIIATAQSVLLRNAANGAYRVYVAYDPTSIEDNIPFEALAEVEYPVNAQPTRRLLPDLVARPQRNVTFDTPWLDFFEPVPPPGESCFGSEAAEHGAQTCLRSTSRSAA